MTKKQKGSVSKETFDDFLANQGILGACEDHAIKEIIAEQLAAAMEQARHHQSRNGGADENQPPPA